MGRLTVEVEQSVKRYYEIRGGHLIVITDGDQAGDISGRVEKYCQRCGLCTASSPVVSLGEVKLTLRNSGLFAVGPIDIKDKRKCP